MPGRRTTYVVAALTGLAAVLRFATLDAQSFWHDEAITVEIVRGSFLDMLAAVPDTESTPPFYYALAWVWSQVFGTTEVGLRSLSALLGTATVPVVYAAGRQLVSARVGLLAAAFASVSPYLIWYSQEARSYALLTLLCGLSLIFASRAIRRPGRRALLFWAVVSALAIATHYFAVFLIVAEAAWLCSSLRLDRRLLASFGAIGAACIALLPLALMQARATRNDWFDELGFRFRTQQLATNFVTGVYTAEWLWLVPLALTLVAAVALLEYANESERRVGLLVLALGGATIAIPLALALVGLDFFYHRNLIPAWIPLAIGLATALGAARAARVGVPVAAGFCVALLATTVYLHRTERFHRDDWRTAAAELGEPKARAIITWPGWDRAAFRVYRPLARVDDDGTRVDDLYVLGMNDPPASLRVPEGFGRVERRTISGLQIMRYRARHPVTIRPSDFRDVGLPVYVERP